MSHQQITVLVLALLFIAIAVACELHSRRLERRRNVRRQLRIANRYHA